jgi:hypothetical protein
MGGSEILGLVRERQGVIDRYRSSRCMSRLGSTPQRASWLRWRGKRRLGLTRKQAPVVA